MIEDHECMTEDHAWFSIVLSIINHLRALIQIVIDNDFLAVCSTSLTPPQIRAPDKRLYLMIIRDNFCIKTLVVTPHLNRCVET